MELSPKENQIYQELAAKLVTPERYGKVALDNVIRLPEINRVYNEGPDPLAA